MMHSFNVTSLATSRVSEDPVSNPGVLLKGIRAVLHLAEFYASCEANLRKTNKYSTPREKLRLVENSRKGAIC